jgi:hypothetical protein
MSWTITAPAAWPTNATHMWLQRAFFVMGPTAPKYGHLLSPNEGTSDHLTLSSRDHPSLIDLSSGIPLNSTAPTVIWGSVRVPASIPGGVYTTQLTLTPNGGPTVTIPLEVTVWEWTIPLTGHFEGIYQGCGIPDQ